MVERGVGNELAGEENDLLHRKGPLSQNECIVRLISIFVYNCTVA